MCISEARVRDLWNIVEMFVEPFRILCAKRATLSLYTFSNLRIPKRILNLDYEINILKYDLRYLSGAPAAKYDIGKSMNSRKNDKLKDSGLTSSKKISYL